MGALDKVVKRVSRSKKKLRLREEDDEFVLKEDDIKKLEHLGPLVLARFERAAQSRLPWEDEWASCVAAWFQQFVEPEEMSWRSQRYLPVILKHTETALPAIVSAVLDPKGMFRCQGMQRQGKDAAQANERLLNWQVEHVSGAEEAYEDMFWWALLQGTGYLDHDWDRREDERYVPVVEVDPETGKKEKKLVWQEILVADHPIVHAPNPWDIFLSPDARMGDDLPWYVQRAESTIDDVMETAGHGHIHEQLVSAWLEEGRPQLDSHGGMSWFDGIGSRRWKEMLDDAGYPEGDDDHGDDLVRGDRALVLLRYVSKKWIVTMASPTHVIGVSRNPYIHGKTGLVVHHFLKIPDSPYGRGLGGILLGHQSLANENINAWMDTANLERMAPIILDKSRAQLMDEETVVQPNAIFRVRGLDAIKRLELPAPTNLAMQIDSHLMRDADDLTGFTEQSRGLSPSANQTATAFQGLQSNLRTRMVTHVRRASRTIKRSGALLVKLNQQFYDQETVVSYTGEDGMDYVPIQPHEIVGDMVISVSVSTSRATPEIRAQRLLQLLQVLVPLVQTGMIDQPQVRRLVRMVLDANEVEDADLIIPKGHDRMKDPEVENALLAKGIAVPIHPKEPHTQHVQSHQAYLEALLGGEIQVDDQVVAAFAAHQQLHFDAIAQQQAAAMAAQQGQQPGQPGQPGQEPGAATQEAQGASGAGIDQGGGPPARQAATMASGATGGQGMPGVAAPGGAAPGRMG